MIGAKPVVEQAAIQQLAKTILELESTYPGSNLIFSIDLSAIARYLGASAQELEFCAISLMNAIVDQRRKFQGLTLYGAFSLDFPEHGYFDVKTSPCFNGHMANLMISNFIEHRSRGPIYSFFCFGGDDVQPESLPMNATATSFGHGSVFEKLVQEKFKLVSVGHHYASSFTISHHFEQLADVDYRYLKRFQGTVRSSDGTEALCQTDMYVRGPETVFSGLTLSGGDLLVEKLAVDIRYIKGHLGGLLVYSVDLHRVGQIFYDKSNVQKYIRPIFVKSNIDTLDRPIRLLESRALYAQDLRARR